MAKNIKLKERDTNQVMYPLTTSDQVLYSDNREITTVIEDLQEQINNVSVSNDIPIATSDVAGIVKVGSGLSIDSSGNLSCTVTNESGEITTLPAESIPNLSDWLDNTYDPWYEVNENSN